MRTIIITGATGKIGSLLTKKFLDCGDIVIALGRSEKRLLSLKENQINCGERLLTLPIDLCDNSASKNLIDWY